MVYQRGKQKTWWFRFRFAGRIVHESARTTSKTVARDAERQRRRELETKWNKIEKRTLPPTFEIAKARWLEAREGRVAGNTLSIGRHALKHLTPAFGGRLLCDISARDIETYQGKRRREGAEGRTVNIEVGVLRQILSAYRLWEPLVGEVQMLTERKDVGRALTPVEEERLLQATVKTDSACHTATLLALNTAMRKNEIRMLQWKQVDWTQRIVSVGTAKTAAGTGRVIPLNLIAFEALARWAGRFPESKPEHYVFPACEACQIEPNRPTKGWRTAWRTAIKRAGVHCRFHDLRVTCITKLAESQTSDMTIMAIAGHVSRRMLEHYSRIRMDAKRKALEGIAGRQNQAVFQAGVHQIGNQIAEGRVSRGAN